MTTPSQDVAALARQAHLRILANLPFTRVQDLMLYVNPGKEAGEGMRLFSDNMIKAFHPLLNNSRSENDDPHIYDTCRELYVALGQPGSAHMIMHTGETGSGKTLLSNEALRFFLQDPFVNDDSNNVTVDPILRTAMRGLHDTVQQVNTLLEIFGNASTLHNANSSRFAKITEIEFVPIPLAPSSAPASPPPSSTILLVPVHVELAVFAWEQTRSTTARQGERNFHVLTALDAEINGKHPSPPNKATWAYCAAVLGSFFDASEVEAIRSVLEGVLLCSQDNADVRQTEVRRMFRVQEPARSGIWEPKDAGAYMYEQLFMVVLDKIRHKLDEHARILEACIPHDPSCPAPLSKLSLVDVPGFEQVAEMGLDQLLFNVLGEVLFATTCDRLSVPSDNHHSEKDVPHTHLEAAEVKFVALLDTLTRGAQAGTSVAHLAQAIDQQLSDTDTTASTEATRAYRLLSGPGGHAELFVDHSNGAVKYTADHMLSHNLADISPELQEILDDTELALFEMRQTSEDEETGSLLPVYRNQASDSEIDEAATDAAATLSARLREDVGGFLLRQAAMQSVRVVHCVRPFQDADHTEIDMPCIVRQLEAAGVASMFRLAARCIPSQQAARVAMADDGAANSISSRIRVLEQSDFDTPFVHSPAKNPRSPRNQTLSLDEGVSSLLHGYQETRQDLLQQAQKLGEERRALVKKLSGLEQDSTDLRDKVSILELDVLKVKEDKEALQDQVTRLLNRNQALYVGAKDSLAAQAEAESAVKELDKKVTESQRLVQAHSLALIRQEKLCLRLLIAQLRDSPILVRAPPDALSGQKQIAKQAKDILSALNNMTYAWDIEACETWSEEIFQLVDSDGHLNHKVIPLLQLLHVWRDLETVSGPIDKLILDSWIDRTETALLRRLPEELQNAVLRGGSAPEILRLLVGRTLTAGMLLSAPHPRSALKAAMQVAMNSFAPSGTVQQVSFKIGELETVKAELEKEFSYVEEDKWFVGLGRKTA